MPRESASKRENLAKNSPVVRTPAPGDSSAITFGVQNFKQLINNAYLSDVVFKVGQAGELIYAHKLIITIASEVFYTQFNGSFAESRRGTLADPVIIEDIEPAVFLALLRYIYCGEVDIQPDNMLDMFYVSEKYMLKDLNTICQEAIEQKIDSTNVLEVFQHNRRYGFDTVDHICLNIICDNPILYFKQDCFLALNLDALKMIASRRAMNCHTVHLEEAIEEWEQANHKTEIKVQVGKLLGRKLRFHEKGGYRPNIDTYFTLFAAKGFMLHGIGIYIGVENDEVPSPDCFVTVIVSLNAMAVEETLPVVEDLKVHEIIFEKQVMMDQQWDVTINVIKPDHLKNSNLFHLTGFALSNSRNITVKGRQLHMRGYSHNSHCNCVAYLIV